MADRKSVSETFPAAASVATPLASRDVTGVDAIERSGLKMSPRSTSWKLWAVALWLTFSTALAIWWLIFGLRQIDRLSALDDTGTGRLAIELGNQHRMLMSEGLTLIFMLIIGGIALLYYIGLEMKRSRHLRNFFAAFTHDLKTSLASLRLQAESLEEDLKDSGHSRLARRLVKDTVRLELQLENSLLLSSPTAQERLLMEPISIGDLFQTMRHHWPDLEITFDGEGVVLADQRAIESILKNVLQNAVIHGRATRITAEVRRESEWLCLRIKDNGRGFKGDIQTLGRMFHRHGSSSGSGLGIYLAMSLAKRMQGDLRICPSSSVGFCVELLLLERREMSLEAET